MNNVTNEANAAATADAAEHYANENGSSSANAPAAATGTVAKHPASENTSGCANATAAATPAAEIARAFAGGKAFIPFLTCGDPDLATSEELIVAMAEAGAGLIELGIPFSDPTAEGPVIQEANLRALANGVTTDDVFALIERVRTRTDVPLAIMTYANVVYGYGIERFCERMAQSNVGALILPDVPFEEKAEFAEPCRAAGVSLVSMVAPTSAGRVQMIAREAEGFVYCVSSLGVTGMRSSLGNNATDLVKQVHEANPAVPCAIGFGISTPEQARDMAAFADGAIVGSAIVRIIAEHGRNSIEPVRSFVQDMVNAVREA